MENSDPRQRVDDDAGEFWARSLSVLRASQLPEPAPPEPAPPQVDPDYSLFEGRRIRTTEIPERAWSLQVYEHGVPTNKTIGDIVAAARARDQCEHIAGTNATILPAGIQIAAAVRRPDARTAIAIGGTMSGYVYHRMWQAALDRMETLTSCRNHWKTAFEHERANVIRLRGIVAVRHAGSKPCQCEDCQLVRSHNTTPL